MTAWNDSNYDYGLTAILDRPDEIPQRWDDGLHQLAVYAAERMRVARHALETRDAPAACQRRLCYFWGDVSRLAHQMNLGRVITEILDDLTDDEYEAAGIWMDGRWHPDSAAMAMILWHLQVSPRVVSAAFDLHRRAARRSSTASNDFRTGRRGPALLSLACLIATPTPILRIFAGFLSDFFTPRSMRTSA
jgi:hypothetical protein